jgi:ribosomal protein S15P/S13E
MNFGVTKRGKGNNGQPADEQPKAKTLSEKAAEVYESMTQLEEELARANAARQEWEMRAKVAEGALAESRRLYEEQTAILNRRIADLEHANDDAKAHNERILGKMEANASMLLDCLPRRGPSEYAPRPQAQRVIERAVSERDEDEEQMPLPQYLKEPRKDES